MTTHNIEVSEEVYQRLCEYAAFVDLTVEQLIERFAFSDLPHLLRDYDDEDAIPPMPPAGSEEALAALDRLRHLFDDPSIPNSEEILDNPMIPLANADTHKFDL